MLSPYEGRLLTALMISMDLAKVAAGAGYLALSVPTISEWTARVACRYICIVMLVSMCVGLLLAVVQIAANVIEKVKEKCGGRRAQVAYADDRYVNGYANVTMTPIANAAQ